MTATDFVHIGCTCRRVWLAEELSKGMADLRREIKWKNKPGKDQACLCLVCLKQHKFSSENGKKHLGVCGTNKRVTTVSWVLG